MDLSLGLHTVCSMHDFSIVVQIEKAMRMICEHFITNAIVCQFPRRDALVDDVCQFFESRIFNQAIVKFYNSSIC